MSRTIALIPARSGSQRVPDKNIRSFFGYPLMAYAIHTAIESQRFDDVYMSSDSQEYLDIASKYGAKTILRPKELADGNMEAWVRHALDKIDYKVEYFAVLPPTNPFRGIGIMDKAFGEIYAAEENFVFNLQVKSMELCKQHPYKMFKWNQGKHTMRASSSGHNMPYQELEEYYIQNGCIYISKADSVKFNNEVLPVITQGYEGFDINTEDDWILAEELVKRGKVKLPNIDDTAR